MDYEENFFNFSPLLKGYVVRSSTFQYSTSASQPSTYEKHSYRPIPFRLCDSSLKQTSPNIIVTYSPLYDVTLSRSTQSWCRSRGSLQLVRSSPHYHSYVLTFTRRSDRDIRKLSRHGYYSLLQRRLDYDIAMIDECNGGIRRWRIKLDQYLIQRLKLRREEVCPRHVGLVILQQCIKDTRARLRRLERQRRDHRMRLKGTVEDKEQALREDGNGRARYGG